MSPASGCSPPRRPGRRRGPRIGRSRSRSSPPSSSRSASALRAGAGGPYLVGTLVSGFVLFLFSPLVARYGGVGIPEGPEVPVIGQLDVCTSEVSEALFQSLRLIAVGLAFAAYALLLDLDGLLLAGGRLRRSVLAVALATRLVPTLERDAAGYVEALRGRGLVVEGVRGRARLISPLVAGSLERSQPRRVDGSAGSAGRPDPRRRPPWTALDRVAIVA